jgi:chaperone required for assembly of F1-ATPase
VPHRGLADAISAEWQGQGEFIDASSMPVTRLANSAIDGVAERADDVRREVLAYAASDLLCYRAKEPAGLVQWQSRLWDPIVAWAEDRFRARFVLAAGVVHVEQPAHAMALVAETIGRYDDPFRLAGLHIATTLSGSALIALALAEGALDEDAAWEAAHVDEDWNISQWGEDAEAAERRARRRAEFHAAALALQSDRSNG